MPSFQLLVSFTGDNVVLDPIHTFFLDLYHDLRLPVFNYGNLLMDQCSHCLSTISKASFISSGG